MIPPLLTAAKVAARSGLVAILGAGAVFAQTPTPTTATTDATKQEAQKLEKFEVTGSRIKRLDYETPAPVESFTVPEIEAKGFTNIGDFMQSLPFNSGNVASIFETGSFQRGASTSNFRGLGAQRFLTLVNGRRAVPYALSSPNAGTRQVFDFNSLPSAAIESIEFLKDGASALYGSDAITGVLNIKLKKNFSGLSTSAYYGSTLKGQGGDTGVRQISIVAGSGSGKTKVTTAIDAKMSNSNFLHDYGVKTTDYSSFGTNKGSNLNSSSPFPSVLTLTRAQAASAGIAFPSSVAATVNSWTYVINGGQQTANPTLASFVPAPANPANANAVLLGNENRYNFAATYQLYPAYDYVSNFTSFEHEINDNLKAFAEIIYSKNSTYYAFTPVPITFSTDLLTLPANNPYNPFGIPLTSLSSRAVFLPVRKFDVESTSANFLAGLRGTFTNRWDWEAAVGTGFSNVATVSRNAIRASTLQDALNGTTRATAFNPFGPSDPAVIANLSTVSPATARTDALSFDANVSGRLFDLPGGSLGIAAGFEARNEKLQSNPDTAAYLGSSGGVPVLGKRTVVSQYVEITAPLWKSERIGSAEVQLAGRHEHYNDFGDTTKPKVGVAVRLPSTRFANLLLRGSYSESFQAPVLALLYSKQTAAVSGTVLQDPLRPQDVPTQMRIIQGGNPNLLPEIGKVQYFGGVIEFPKVRNLSLSVDFFDIRIKQYIVIPGTNYLLSALGRAQFPNAIVRDNTQGNPGPILRVESVPSNNPDAYQIYRGADYGIRYALRNTRLGSFQFSGTATQIFKRGTDSGLGGGFFNNAGYYYDPRWRGTVNTSWNYKDYGASLNADYIHHWYDDNYTAQGWGENPRTVVGAQLRYGGFWNSTISIGASNVFNARPWEHGRETVGFSPNIGGNAALGRFLYVRVRKEF